MLRTLASDAYWVTSWPFAEYTHHAWAGAWLCSAFRNEGPILSSELVRDAIAATRWEWPEIPDLGMVTFIDPTKVIKRRDFGRCFRKAGFLRAICPAHGRRKPRKWVPGCEACRGFTKGGLVALQLFEDAMPDPQEPIGVTRKLFA